MKYSCLTGFLSRINVFDWKEAPDPVNEDFGQGGNELLGSDEYVDAMGPFADDTEALDCECQPIVSLLLDLGPEIEPVLALGAAEEAPDVVPVIAVDLLDLAVAKGQLSHPVDAASNSTGEADAVVGGVAVEAVAGEIVGGEVLAVVVRGDVVDVRLVAVLRAQMLRS